MKHNYPSHNPAWEIRLYGGFGLVAPSGERIHLRHKGLEGLVAILALAGPEGVARADAGAILWPTRDSDVRSTNLRPALTALRKVLGAEAIDARPGWCAFSPGFAYRIVEQKPDEVFMRGHQGGWFEDHRAAAREESAPVRNDEPSLGDLARGLTWLSRWDKEALLMTMKGAVAYVNMLPYQTLQELVATCRSTTLAGWLSYWRAESQDNPFVAIPELKKAVKQARIAEDQELLILAIHQLGRTYSRIGRLDRVLQAANALGEVAAKRPNPLATSRSLVLQGLAHWHWGDTDRGIRYLEDSLSWSMGPGEALRCSVFLTGVYASTGRFSEAERLLKSGGDVWGELPDSPLNHFNRYATHLLQWHRGQKEAAIEGMKVLSGDCLASGNKQYAAYCLEFAAAGFNSCKERSGAAKALKGAQRLRREIQMPFLPSETERLPTQLAASPERCPGVLM
ncbi:MAG TPA: hypothetical protein VG944_09195 [Fimbriimonas sp.]|nr:hypothetical protein [Fimbriimonas sp.]